MMGKVSRWWYSLAHGLCWTRYSGQDTYQHKKHAALTMNISWSNVHNTSSIPSKKSAWSKHLPLSSIGSMLTTVSRPVMRTLLSSSLVSSTSSGSIALFVFSSLQGEMHRTSSQNSFYHNFPKKSSQNSFYHNFSKNIQSKQLLP